MPLVHWFHHRRPALAALAVLAGVSGAGANTTPASWAVRAPGFALEPVATGLQLPVSIAMLPAPGAGASAPLAYIAELPGTIRLVRRDGSVSTYASNLLNFAYGGPIPGAGEQGLTGIAVEPASGDVLAAVLYDPAPPSAARSGRIIRLHSSDGGLTAASQATVLDFAGEPVAGSLAAGLGAVSIGPDGKVYAQVGDGGDGTAAQNPTLFRGKVLRLNPDGSAPTDNPSYNAADGIGPADYTFASGLHAPFAGAWRLSDGARFFTDPGPVNVDRFTRLVRARNYLYDGTDASMANFALYTWTPAATPLGVAIVQPGLFGGSGWPSNLWNRAVFGEAGPAWSAGPAGAGKRLSYSFLDAGGTTAGAPIPLVEYTGAGRSTVGAVAAGPDGVYFTDLYKETGAAPAEPGANLYRVRYIGVPDFTVSSPSTAVSAPLTVTFTDASIVPGAAAWRWEFGDGTVSAQQNPSHTYTRVGEYTVTLTVTGTAGPASVSRPAAVRVGNPVKLAVIGGTLPASSGDAAVATALRALGYDVTNLDDEPANRPAAGALASTYTGVLISSTVTSANIAGEFRTANIPMVFWEGALLTTAREGLASSTASPTNQTQIAVTNAAHPVMAGLGAGPVTVFASAQTLGAAAGTIAPNAQALATVVGTPAQPAVLVAEAGTTLLSNYVTPARRVFLFYNDTSFTSATAQGRCVLTNSVCWACNLFPAVTQGPAPQSVAPGATATFTIASTGHPLRTYQWRRNGAPVYDGDLGGRISGAGTTTLTITGVQPGDAGVFDAVVSTSGCGSVTSPGAALSITGSCRPDFNHSGAVTVQDIFDFLAAYFMSAPMADFNASGSVTVQDIFDFLAAYFTGC